MNAGALPLLGSQAGEERTRLGARPEEFVVDDGEVLLVVAVLDRDGLMVVGGEVRSPGLVSLPRGTPLSQAVARAGGPTERGRLDRVTLLRGGRSYSLNLLSDDLRTAVMPIASGDQIFVARRRDFNVVRDVFSPVASLAAAVAAFLAYSRR